MSFKLDWNAIEKDSFATYTTELLEEALNSGKRPPILSDDIKIVDLNFGTIAPNFQILEIGDLGVDKFRGIFNFKYYGDASITVRTKISASLLKNYNNNIGEEYDFIKPAFVVSDCDFDIPLNLTLSNFKMSSIMIIVFSKTKGLTLVFKNDPLENIDVSSTFDRITPIANFLQKKIESKISDLFKEFLPSLLYKFSLKYTTQSFDQFHKDLLIEEQVDDKRKNKVLLKDLDPENPFRISPGSLMRSTRLSSMRQTLSLGNGIDKLSCDRFNKDIITKAFMNILNKSNNYNSNRVELSEHDFEFGNVHDKLIFIKNFQSKASKNSTKPKRRIIKMNVKKPQVNGEEKQQHQEEMQEEVTDKGVNTTPSPVSTTPVSGYATSVELNKSANTSVFSESEVDTSPATTIRSNSRSTSVSRSTSTRPSFSSSGRPSLAPLSTPMSRKSTSNKTADLERRSSTSKSRRPSTNTSTHLQMSQARKYDPYMADEREIRRRLVKLDRLVRNTNSKSPRLMLSTTCIGSDTDIPPPYTG